MKLELFAYWAANFEEELIQMRGFEVAMHYPEILSKRLKLFKLSKTLHSINEIAPAKMKKELNRLCADSIDAKALSFNLGEPANNKWVNSFKERIVDSCFFNRPTETNSPTPVQRKEIMADASVKAKKIADLFKKSST